MENVWFQVPITRKNTYKNVLPANSLKSIILETPSLTPPKTQKKKIPYETTRKRMKTENATPAVEFFQLPLIV